MILAVLQARLSSKRLPGKVLQPILGKPMLVRQIERIQRATKIDRLVVATSSDLSDDVLAQTCKEYGIDCFRGSLNDVLDRFYQVAVKYGARHIVRLTGDCPLTEPTLIDSVIECHLQERNDATGADMTCYPDGLDVDVFSFEALQRTWQEACLASEREHVAPYIWNHPELFKLGSLRMKNDWSALRWTVDGPEDFIFVTRIYEALYNLKPDFSMIDIWQYVNEHPELMQINAQYRRNEGYEKSLREDYIVKN